MTGMIQKSMVGLQWKEVLSARTYYFLDHLALLPPCNMIADNLYNSSFCAIKSLIKEILQTAVGVKGWGWGWCWGGGWDRFS